MTLGRSRLDAATADSLNQAHSTTQPAVVTDGWDVFGRLHEQSSSWLAIDDSLPDGRTVCGALQEFTGYVYYCLTLVQFFDSTLDEQRLRRAVDPVSAVGSLDSLTSSRQAFAVGAHHAWQGITAFRRSWQMEPCPAFPGGEQVRVRAGTRRTNQSA